MPVLFNLIMDYFVRIWQLINKFFQIIKYFIILFLTKKIKHLYKLKMVKVLLCNILRHII
jgi:hypothetical protein